MQKNIAIVGTAPSSCMLAPFDDPEWEVWACSMANQEQMPPSVETWFEVHHLDLISGGGKRAAQFVEFLATKPMVYLTTPDPRIPHAKIINVEGLTDHFSSYFFSSSIAWMLAVAISKKPKQIGIYGVDMGSKSEYAEQRPGCQFFIREATCHGIEIVVPVESDLLEPRPLYGVCMHDPAWRKLSIQAKELQARLNAAEAKVRHDELEASFLRGALEQNDKDRNTYTGNNCRMKGAKLYASGAMPALREDIQSAAPASVEVPTEPDHIAAGDEDRDDRATPNRRARKGRSPAANGQDVSGEAAA